MSVTVVLVTALVLILSVQTYHSLLEEGFRERSIAYTQAFAASASTWLAPVNAPMLTAAAPFMLVGSALFVQVVLEDGSVIEERGEGAVELSLAISGTPAALTAEKSRSPSGTTYLDIVAPLPTGIDASIAGYVRIGIDASSVTARGRNTALLAIALGIAIDILLILLLRWALRGRLARDVERTTSRATGGAEETAETPIIVGPLRIDTASKEVRFSEALVALTPKQYALVVLLASAPGRVFSEREIVDAVWADSPYADSKDVKQYVYLVRQRLAKADPTARDLIATVPGFGYKLVPEDVDGGLTDS